ncbi:PmgT [Roseibium sp. TrichSKD4]|uniref:hypothetical protein n=1 Tax=Roseibium sp. TrichSKD4 TaxID=744980 RepID=UPI0001E56399|nr:hypothetical protein [Roseibium sp. TrichSKD4]EFO33923.1 PmgT [Roseibium sp. TrichSKD4]
MRVRDALFTGSMVIGLLEDRKTQTRRVMNRLLRFGPITEFGPSDTRGYDWQFRDKRLLWNDLRHDALLEVLPYQVGDLLYVREAWKTFACLDKVKPSELPVNDVSGAGVLYLADGTWRSLSANGERCKCRVREITPIFGRYRPGMHMPRWASRITLKVTDVRVQRLQDISEKDAKAEGVCAWVESQAKYPWGDISDPLRHLMVKNTFGNAKTAFECLWDSLNGDRNAGIYAWDANPWVIAVSFEVIKANVDTVLSEVAA